MNFYKTYKLFFLLALTVAVSCKKDTDSVQPVAQNNCDVSMVKYNSMINSIIQQNCISCHSANSIYTNLTFYDTLKVYARNGELMKRIKRENGYGPMPPNSSLDDCAIKKIEKWINDGSPNN